MKLGILEVNVLQKKTMMCFMPLNLGKDMVVLEDMVEVIFSIEVENSFEDNEAVQEVSKRNKIQLDAMVKFLLVRYAGR